MKLIKKLQECSTLGQADPILTKLGAGPAVKKLVETAIILSHSQDPQQRSHAYSFMESAIKEMEGDDHKLNEEEDNNDKDKKLNEEEDNNDKDKKLNEEEDKDHTENKIHEEELKNFNTGPREKGSEQSSENTEPYPGTAKDSTSGEKPMQDMDNTENQWNETGAPGMGAPMTPQMGPPLLPGLAPDVAQEMGMVLPKLPPMDTNQMMRQMQYTLNDYHKRVIFPMSRLLKQQREAIKVLSTEIRETKVSSGSMKLDLETMRKNAGARFRETESVVEGPMYNGMPMSGLQPQTTRKKDQLDKARTEINEMDKIIRSEDNSIYG